MREIHTLRARWRELETEPPTRLNGHEGGNPGYSQASVLTGHRASSRPYQESCPMQDDPERWKCFQGKMILITRRSGQAHSE